MNGPYGDGRYAAEPPDGGELDITDIFHFVDPKTYDPDNDSRLDSQYPNVAIITFDKPNQFGGMWAKEQLDLTLPFSTTMYLYQEREYGVVGALGDLGDGMTFTLQNDPEGINAIGGAGEGLGVYRGRKWTGVGNSTVVHGTFLQNSLVVEFDTYQNWDALVKDPYENNTRHCAVLIPTTENIVVSDHREAFKYESKKEWVEFKATWTPNDSGGGTLDYRFGDWSRTFPVPDIMTTFNDTKVYWGFTGASGSATSVQAVAIDALPRQGISVVKTVTDKDGNDIDNGVVSPGDTIIYTIRATTITHPIGPVDIMDNISQYITVDGSSVMLTTITSGTISWPVTMAGETMSVNTAEYLDNEGDWIEITFEARVHDDAGGETIINGATVSAAGLSSPEDTNETHVSVFAEPAKRVSNTSDAGQNNSAVNVGDLITYEILYENDSPSDEDIVITDTLPDGVSFESASHGGDYQDSTNTVTWTLNGVEAGTTDLVSLVVRVNETAVVTIENQASVRIGTNAPVLTNWVENPVAPENPVKAIDPSSETGSSGTAVKQGDEVIYSITYLNNLTIAATVTITDVLPDGVDFVRASNGGIYDKLTRTVTWTLTNVPSAERGLVMLTVQVNDDAVVTIENSATVQVGTEDPLPTDPIINPVTPQDPVKMVSTNSRAGQSGSAVKEGDRITYDITYLNYHETDAEIVITDVLDPGVDFVSATDGGLYNDATRTVTWTINNVPSAGRGKVSLVVQVNEKAAVTVEDSATVQVGGDPAMNTNTVVNPLVELQCPRISRVCRISIEGCKIWADNDNADYTRPDTVEIVLLRDGEVYRRKTIDSTGDGKYIFSCLPVWKNSEDRYSYKIDELEVPANYIKRVEGYNVINTLITP